MRMVRRSSVVLAGALASSGLAMLPAQARDTAAPTTLQLEGTVRLLVVDRFGDVPSSDRRFSVVTDSGTAVPVDLPEQTPADGRFEGELVVDGDVATALKAKDLLPPDGSTIAQDTRAGRAAVAAAEREGAPLEVASSSVAPAAAAAKVTPIAHRAYVAKMTGVGSVDGTDAEIGSAVDSMLGYWRAEPGAMTSFDRTGTLTSFAAPTGVTLANGCGMLGPDDQSNTTLAKVFTAAANTFPGINFTLPGNHLVVLAGDECGTSGPVGIANVGSSVSDGGPSMLTFDPDIFPQVGAHEIGHNFGLEHANLHSSASPDPGYDEYLDLYSPMGLAIGSAPQDPLAPPALGTLRRRQLGLDTAGEVVGASVAAGQPQTRQTYSIAPRTATSGARSLLATDPVTGTTYSIDFRTGQGRDTGTLYSFGAQLQDPFSPVYDLGIVIERQAADGQVYLMTQTATDPDAGSYFIGDTFAPSPGLSLSVDALTYAAATVTLTLTAPAPPVAPARLVAATPRISGTAKVGRTLKVKVGSWSPKPSFTYQWFANGKRITSKGTKSSFKLTAKQKGKRITVRVTGRKSGYVTVTTTSRATKKVAKR